VALEAPAPAPGTGAPPNGTDGSRAGNGHGAPGGSKPTRVVSADVSLRRRLGEIWHSRELLGNLVRTEIKVKYKSSVLGIIWSMIAPAMTLAIFFVVFSFLLKNGIPNFVIFLFSGLLIWNFFQTAVQTGTGTVVANSGLVKKVAFPREILALASVGTAAVFLFFQSVVMAIFLLVLRSSPDWSMFPELFLALLAGAVLAAALAIFLSAINVHLRDTQHLIEVLLTAWFWACPIVYAYQLTIAPRIAPGAKYHGIGWIYFLNPMTPLVMTFQRVLYNIPVGRLTRPPYAVTRFLPTWPASTYALADLAVLGVALVLFVLALVVFGRLEGNFAEDL